MAINRIKTGGITDATIQSGDIAPGTIASDRLAGSVANAKLANSSITINGTAVALGGSVTAGTDWQAVTVADGSTQLTAVADKGYFLDTNTGVIEVILPTSPSRGDTVVLADYGGNFATNNVRVRAGSNLIDSVETEGSGIGYALSTNNLIVELVYVDSSKGWLVQENEAKSSLTAAADTNLKFIEATGGTVTTSGNFKIHTFTGDGCFVVSAVGNEGGSNSVDYLVVAGGGSGSAKGPGDAGGGGGAGGFRYSNSTFPVACAPGAPLASSTAIPVSATTFPISVGGGGAGNPNPGGPCAPNGNGANGSNSVFSTITSAGGGKGGYATGCRNNGTGGPGGSGGGAMSGTGSGPTIATGAGNTPPVSPPQGNPGGTFSYGGSSPNSNAAGGGGALAAASNSTGGGSSFPGGAGAGLPTAFGSNGVPCGSFRYYAGGGGAGAYSQSPAGGIGGGGNGNAAGTANSGGGGGGGVNGPGSKQGYSGGKGIVVLRYKFQ